MIKINVLEGLRPPLPPATSKEIVEVCIWALVVISIIGGAVFGVVLVLGRLINWL